METRDSIFRMAIFGASGFARETADVCLAAGCRDLVFVDLHPRTDSCHGFPLVDESETESLLRREYQFALGIGDNRARQRISAAFPLLPYPNLVHPSSSFGWRQLEVLNARRGNIIAAGVRFTNGIIMGDFGIFNLNCTIGHDCVIEDYVNIAPGATVSGNVHLAEGSYIGTNAAVLQGRSEQEKLYVGRWSVVGAGAVVVKDAADGAVVVGVPARPLPPKTERAEAQL